MDLEKLSPGRRAVMERIAEYEAAGRFDEDVEDDPPAPVLMPDCVDYGNTKLLNRIVARFANRAGDRFFTKLIKQGAYYLDGVTGREHLTALKNGAVITCNHFHACDSYLISKSIEKELPKHRLWKVIREGNYTNFPGNKFYAYLFKHAYTLPLSSNRRTMMNFIAAVYKLLQKKESILIYAEQGMWYNYRKPRPTKISAYKIAAHAHVPVLPAFITMEDDEKLDGDGFPVQHYTLHFMPPIYPDSTLREAKNAEIMQERNYALCKEKYEEVYKIPLEFTGPEKK